MPSTNVERTRMSVLLTRHGTSCIFSLSRKDKDRCAQPLRPRERASALRLVQARSDTVNLFAGAAGGVRFRGPRKAIAAALPHATQRYRTPPGGLLPAV